VEYVRPWVLILAIVAVSGSLFAPVHARDTGRENTNATCCERLETVRHLAQIRWHLLRTWLGSGAGDLIFVSAADIGRLHATYKKYLSQLKGCREVGLRPQKRPTGKPYPHMWLMVSAAFGDSRVVRVWDHSTPAPVAKPASGKAATHIYLVPQVLHRRSKPPHHCLVLASPGRWRLLRVRR
jgi:hypothetical protein